MTLMESNRIRQKLNLKINLNIFISMSVLYRSERKTDLIFNLWSLGIISIFSFFVMIYAFKDLFKF